MLNKNHERGFFSQLGSVHLHIDGKVHYAEIKALIKNISSEWNEDVPCKINKIKKAIEGPQAGIQDFIETYNNHNPISAKEASFDFFSTILLSNELSSENETEVVRKSVIKKIQQILPHLIWNNTVVEMEQIIAKIDFNNSFSQLFINSIETIKDNELGVGGIDSSKTHRYEIHHGFDLLKESEQPPLSLNEILVLCDKELDINSGGWFLFENNEYWSYRSNLFENDKNLAIEVAQDQDKRLRDYLELRFGSSYLLKTLVEKILGIWTYKG